MLASRKNVFMILPEGAAVLGVCNCASGLGPMSQGGFSDLPMESSRHGEILGRSSSGRWCGATSVWLWLLPSVPQSDLHPTAVRAASELQQRRRRNNTPTPKHHRPSASTPPPPRPHTIYTPTLAAPPRRPGESPPRLRSASCAEPRARMCLPTPAAPSHICAKRAHRPSALS